MKTIGGFLGAIIGAAYYFSIKRKKRAVIGSFNTLVKSETDWFEPYLERPFPDRGKWSGNVKAAKGKSGCYIIKEGSKVVYIGMSKNQLYNTITRHFQKWTDNKQLDRITYDVWSEKYKIKILYASPSKVDLLECELYNKYNPRDNKDNPCPYDFSDVPF